MIPKIIHYCWFGKGNKSELILKCIDSWAKYCPDYEILEWNEENFDFSDNKYAREAYQNKLWAFVSDYARLKIIYDNGGIYLDTDVELIKNLDFLLDAKFFCGFELQNALNTGIGFGAQKKSFIAQQMLEEYKNISFKDHNGKLNITPCTFYNSNALSKQGAVLNNSFQQTSAFTIYPTDFFSPKSYESGIVNVTKNTVSIHHFISSWEHPKSIKKKLRQHRICEIFGQKIGMKIIFLNDLFTVFKNKGMAGSVRAFWKRIRNFLNDYKNIN